jgi:hypothetical protein
MMIWYDEEERYLKVLHDICVQLAKEYMDLYVVTHRFQTKLRIPSIIMSSVSGIASFGSSGFGDVAQRYISISVGVVNVCIAIIQTYESYLKVGEVVSKSLACSSAFKKLADSIYCETFIPVADRSANGVTFLRDCFTRYQTILDQSPPLEFHGRSSSDTLKKAQSIMETISDEIRSGKIGNSSVRTSINTTNIIPEITIEDEPVSPTEFKDMKSIIQSSQPKGTP